jgi:hypothetical protein
MDTARAHAAEAHLHSNISGGSAPVFTLTTAVFPFAADFLPATSGAT